MALRVQQLNADTSFLLTFSPPFAPDQPSKRFPGDYTILMDPWLRGHSSILHPKFQISHHTAEPAITSIGDIKQEIDLIIISQEKSDHCHKETLCSLPRSRRTNILATPAAAKKIRSWKHFDANKVHVMRGYNHSISDSIVRIKLPPYSSSSAPGEITIANIPTKLDLTRLHNAIGITYQPPSTIFTLNAQSNRYEDGAIVQLSGKGISKPLSALGRPRTASSPTHPAFHDSLAKSKSQPDLRSSQPHDVPTGQRRRADSGVADGTSSNGRVNHENVLSIIYTPHGVSPQTLQSYFRNHLTPMRATPVFALFHSMNVEANPWFMGGRIAAGAPGGIEIVKVVGATHWIGAHDEAKDNKGMATVWIKSRRYDVREVREMLGDVGMGQVVLHRLQVGDVLRIPERRVDERENKVQRGRMEVERNTLAMPGPNIHSKQPAHPA